jgi:sigma-54 dependent transcriptional regulator, acetoin dehydrogenase operon transcriptional activator AcoR
MARNAGRVRLAKIRVNAGGPPRVLFRDRGVRTQDVERSQELVAGADRAPGLVVVWSPDDDAIQRFVPLAPCLTLGRREPGDGAPVGRLALADAAMSREHAMVRWRADGTGCEVRDLQSKNGTFVHHRRVAAELAPIGSVVRTGDSFLEVTAQPPDPEFHRLLVGRSARLARLVAELRRAARPPGDALPVHVLIEGETGTGKELVAEVLHELGGRPGKLVAVNCAAIPPELAESYLFGHARGAFTGAVDSAGVFEQAQGGTLLLDEIGELRLDLQAKLLRVLESRQFTPLGSAAPRAATARVIGATNARLRPQVAAGTFRADLFARLAGVEIDVPPLRHRRSDILLLATHFLAAFASGARFAFSANAMERLLLHDWPLNVRELRASCARLAMRRPAGGRLCSADVAAALSPGGADAASPGGTEDTGPPALPSRRELADRLHAHRGNVVKLAGHYGKDRRQIYRWLEAHGLDPRDFRE